MTRRFKLRVLFILLALFAVAAPMAMTYTTSYKIDELNKQKLALEAQANDERDAIRVLQAEWAYLAEPSRIERLAASHLKMAHGNTTLVAQAKDLDAVLIAESRTERLPLPSRERVGVRGQQVASATPSPAKANGLQAQAKAFASSPTRGEVAPVAAAYQAPSPDSVKLVLASFKGQ